MEIECPNIVEALRILIRARKESKGAQNLADKLVLTFPDMASVIEIDYTDAVYRAVRVFGIGDDYSEPMEWRDGDICVDKIATEIIKDWCVCPVDVALDYMDEFVLGKFLFIYQKSNKFAIQIDTMEMCVEDMMDSLVDGKRVGKLQIGYRDEDELCDIRHSIQKWMVGKQKGRLVEEKKL